MVELSPAFKQAVEDSRKLTSKPENNDLLELYALYKIANGEDITTAEKPGMFDLKGKYKYQEWQKRVDEGITQDKAQELYVAKVEELKNKYGFDANKEAEPVSRS
ncbi:putative fatty acid binding protein [Whalleya microplaca]|nr:putative fatty acid binding protein [Whalleya microplaca]